MTDAADDPSARADDLATREQALAEAEIEAALVDARLRGREAGLRAQQADLVARARWIEDISAQLGGWAERAGLDATEALRGLGDGAAQQEADLDAYVRRSGTLLLARSALIATRADLLGRRKAQQQGRGKEVEELDAALARVEVRLGARERLLLAAVQQLEAAATARGAGALPLPALPGRADGMGSARTGERRPSGAHAAGAVAAAPRPSLQLGGMALARGALHIDAAHRALIAALPAPPAVGATLELRGSDGRAVWALLTVVRRALPAADGQPATVILAPQGWRGDDWTRLEELLTQVERA